MTAKACTLCGEQKPLEDFANNRTARDGLQHRCRPCHASLRYADTGPGRARLWEERTRECRTCGKRLWTDEDGHFNDDPSGEVCDFCVAKPRILEERRQRRVEAGRRGAATRQGVDYVPPPPPEVPKKPRKPRKPRKRRKPAPEGRLRSLVESIESRQRAEKAAAAQVQRAETRKQTRLESLRASQGL